MKSAVTLALCALLICAAPAWANIEQLSIGGSQQLQFFSPIGQSFTDVDSVVSAIQADLFDSNPGAAPADHSLTLNLYSGAGFAGSLLNTVTLTDVDTRIAVDHFVQFDFASPLSLTPGNVYTFRLLANSARYNVGASGSNPYAGGTAYLSGSASASADLAFRVLGTPEPSAVVLLSLGFILVRRGRSRIHTT